MSPSEIIPKSRLDEMVARLRHVNSRRCPFDDPGYRMDPLKPCPACGDVGDGPGVDAPSKCVSSNYLVLHAEAAEAIDALSAKLAEAERNYNHECNRHDLTRQAAEASLASVTAERDAMREAAARIAREKGNVANMLWNDNVEPDKHLIVRETAFEIETAIRALSTEVSK